MDIEQQIRNASNNTELEALYSQAVAEIKAIPIVYGPERRFLDSMRRNGLVAADAAYEVRLRELTL